MIAQLDFITEMTAPLSEDDIHSLCRVLEILDRTPYWMSANGILVTLGWIINDNHKRQLRRLVSHSDGQIISGQHGYRHVRHATPEEIAHAANWLDHQAREMTYRAQAIRRRASQKILSDKN